MKLALQRDLLREKLSSPVAKNILWLALDKVIKLLVGLFVGIWLTRYFGPAQWGQLNYIQAILTIIFSLVSLGMDGFLVKEILLNEHKKNEILGTSFIMRLIIAPLAIGCVLVYFQLIDIDRSYYPLFAFLSIGILVSPFELIDIDFQSRLQSRLTVISKNTAYVVGALLKLYLLINSKPIIWLAVIMAIESALSYIMLIVFYQKNNSIFRWAFSKKLVKTFLMSGWPFLVSNLAIILYMRLDQVMIRSMVGEKELGIFSSVVRISDLFVFLPVVISSSLLPSLIKAKQESFEQFNLKISNLINWMTLISVVIAIPVTLFSYQIIEILYGAQFVKAGPILIVHIWSLVPIFIGVASSQYLVIENLQKFNLYKTVLGLACNVLLNLWLIPKCGALGAAYATIISYFVSAIFSNAIFPQTRVLFRTQVKSVYFLFNLKR